MSQKVFRSAVFSDFRVVVEVLVSFLFIYNLWNPLAQENENWSAFIIKDAENECLELSSDVDLLVDYSTFYPL